MAVPNAVPTCYLRTPAASQFLGVSESTLEKLRCFGGGPKFSKLGNKTVVYDPRDLESWAESRKVSSTSEADARRVK